MTDANCGLCAQCTGVPHQPLLSQWDYEYLYFFITENILQSTIAATLDGCFLIVCQCSDAVGWAAGRASGL